MLQSVKTHDTNLDEFLFRFELADDNILSITDPRDADEKSSVCFDMRVIGKRFDKAIVDYLVDVKTGMERT